MDEAALRTKVAAARRILWREGCDSNVGGQVSARSAEHPDAFWATGFEYFDQVDPEEVCLLGYDLQPREGSVKLSPALNAHALIYQRRPDVNAVIHLHSHYVSVFSSLRRPLGMYNVTSVLFHESQALHVDDGTTPHSAVVDSLGDRRVVFMNNHGALLVAETLEQATVEAVTLERCARYDLECRAAGGSEMPAAEVVNATGSFRTFYLQHMWEAMSARLVRDEPVLFADLA